MKLVVTDPILVKLNPPAGLALCPTEDRLMSSKHLRLPCPACSRRLRIRRDYQGMRVICRYCDHGFVVEFKQMAAEAGFDWLARTLAAEPVTLVHRDFQSRNLMLAADAGAALTVIDFQDALLGTRAYDLVALLRDSYVRLAPAEVDALIGFFVDRAALSDPAAFRRLFVLQTLQRKLKDAGRFVFIDRVRKNPSFLRWIPTTIGYVGEALAAAPAELGEVREVLKRRISELNI